MALREWHLWMPTPIFISFPALLFRLSLLFPDLPYLDVSRLLRPVEESGKTTFNRNIIFNTTLPRNCQAIYSATQFFGNTAIGTASLNLAFRVSSSEIDCSLALVLTLQAQALAMWRNHRVLTVLMLTLAGGHWSILLFCMAPVLSHFQRLKQSAGTTSLKATNTTNSVSGCKVTAVNRHWLVALYVYSKPSSL